MVKWYMNYCCRDDYGATSEQYIGMGGDALLRITRARGERSANLAGGQRLDRPPITEARGIFVRTGQMVRQDLSAWKAARCVVRRTTCEYVRPMR